MKTTYRLGTIGDLLILAKQSVLVGFVLVWAVLIGVGLLIARLDPMTAILAGLAATLLHWVSDIFHHLGHAWAARRAGHPMSGILLYGVLGQSLYPKDEPPLPGRIHVQRALGGPLASLLMSVVAGLVVLALRPVGGAATWVALFWFVENLFVFTLQVFLPLGFNDGATLLKYWGQRGTA
ncbi:MAG: hypothetical protein KIT87_12940 [Anaerolineae bacterium]|nr:hypothetical protein [Anaerolineae bacterium]